MGKDLFWAIRGGSFRILLAWIPRLVPIPVIVTVFTVPRTLEQEQPNCFTDGKVHSLESLMMNVPPAFLLQGKSSYTRTCFEAKSNCVKKPIPEFALVGIWKRFWEEDAPFALWTPYGGVMNKISESETPFHRRNGTKFMILWLSTWHSGASDKITTKKHVEWIRRLYDFMTPLHSCPHLMLEEYWYKDPNTCVVLHDSGEKLYKPPLDFQLVGQLKKHRGADTISFWLPQAPPGFVSLGRVTFKSAAKLSDFSILRCISSDMVTGDLFLWDTSNTKFMKEPFMWMVGNELSTFIVLGDFRKPPI
ncbi:unnamed protein product [Coffea canephora]|uniref:Uncharacterized protein n=1 Tax=Coffea canephora TaxID=49390 RepID=A0A068UW19_COFCA|nr:unnamed protein product [Coffea canephora]